MAALADRVKESTATTGQGTVTLAGAAVGFRSFTAAFGNGVAVYYVIAGGAEWEVGIGTTGAGTLSRDTVIGSSAGGTTKVTFSAGTKDVFCSVPASRLVLTDNLASANTANAVVQRDGSGNFAAGTITATLSGNASTATALQTARNINGVSFNGTADITVTAAAGTLTGTTLASNVVSSSLTSVGTLTNLTVTNTITGSVSGSSGSTTGNAATATALQTARTINGVSFNGTADITVTAAAGTLTGTTLASGVTASSLTSVGTLSSLTVSGNLAVDTNTLFVDAVNKRVGVGTATPGVALDVSGAGTELRVAAADTGGIAKVNIFATGTAGASRILFSDTAGTPGQINYEHSTNAMLFNTNGSINATLDASGNLGLGVTPSAWATLVPALQLGTGGSFLAARTTLPEVYLGANAHFDGSNWKYKTAAVASFYAQDTGNHRWFSAAAGANPGDTIAFGNAKMVLDTSGNLGVGATSPSVNGIDVVKSGGTATYVRTSDGTYAMLSGVAPSLGGALVGTTSNHPVLLYANNAERARITTAGELLVGLTSTVGAAKLAIAGTTLSTTNTLSTFSGAYGGFDWVGRATRIFAGTADATNSQIEFYAGVSGAINERFRIKGPGQVRFLPLASAPTTNVEDGDVYYDSGTNKLRVRAAGAWVDLH